MKVFYFFFTFCFLLVFQSGSSQSAGEKDERLSDTIYLNAIKSAGVKMVSIRNGKYKVWTKKAGTGKIKLLLLHGGPGTSPEYFENFPQNLGEKYSIYFYSQLGTFFSDIPNDSSLYSLDSFVNDVEEVRKALQLDSFYLLGHSWGNYLAQAYAAKYQNHLKGIILCNNVNVNKEVVDDYKYQLYAKILESIPEYKIYADSILYGYTGTFTDVSTRNSLGNLIYEKAWPIMLNKHYARLPEPLPDGLLRSKIHSMGKLMSEVGFTEKVLEVDYDVYLRKITIPTLLIGAKYDFIPPYYYFRMRKTMEKNPNVDFYICPNGSHFDMWDDEANFFNAVNTFVLKTENMKR